MDQQVNTEATIEQDTVTRDKKWEVLLKYPHPLEDYWHKNDGPWPQPAPENPVGQMAEVIHLPEQEKNDWRKYVGNMYIRRVLTQWPKGLWYALTHHRYKNFDDNAFNEEISEGLYSKFLTELDEGDFERFKHYLPDLDPDAEYKKADFSCMESVSPHCFKGMYAAPTITLFKKTGHQQAGKRYQCLAIYLYEGQESKQGDEIKFTITRESLFTANDGEAWHLAKYFVLQGAVHRVNLTEHAILHFPYDCINAITKSILPKQHLLFQLLIPHFLLSLGVNKAVLENPGSLINRDRHKFYSPFCAEGIYIRRLLPDGYIGRGTGKENAYPAYSFPLEPKIPPSEYGEYLQAYYNVFAEFVAKVLAHIADDDEESWEYIGLWAECIREWMPGFPKREALIDNSKPKDRELLNQAVTMIMWDLSVAHATDHIAIHNKRPHGNPFRIRVPAPSRDKVTDNWRGKLVKRRDLLTFWFTDLLFYKPSNVTQLQNVLYYFRHKNPETEKALKTLNGEFLDYLKKCEQDLKARGITLPARLEQISTSLQY